VMRARQPYSEKAACFFKDHPTDLTSGSNRLYL
jgi:hypothetical protein